MITREETVTVAISTLGERVSRIVLPPPTQGISWTVLAQDPPRTWPDTLIREDVACHPLPGRGLSKSRNAALDLVTTDLMLLADDDLEFRPDGILTLAAHMAGDPGLALCTGIVARPHTTHGKTARDWKVLRAGRIMSAEIMLRRSRLAELGVRFDEDFGLGTATPTGEEYILMADVLQAGGRATYLPALLAHHPGESTGQDWDDPALIAARFRVIDRVFGRLALPVRLAFALRHRRRLGRHVALALRG